MSTTNQKQLGNTLWSIADPLRVAMDADNLRGSVLPFPFLGCLPDKYEAVPKQDPIQPNFSSPKAVAA
jgi:type I restriction enzyme M protein